MANTSEIRNGLCIRHNHDVWIIKEFQHVKPGKGAAFVRTKMKSLTHGRVVDNTFPSGHKIDIIRVERRKYQFLYKDDMGFNFMNTENYEQISLGTELLDNPQLLRESDMVEILFDAQNETPLQMEMPQYVNMLITYTEPGVKGDTATNSTKPATIETGAEIQVPLFINIDEVVKVDPLKKCYIERVKQ